MGFSLRTFLGGVAIVLFGMDLLESTIHSISGTGLKRRLKKVANTPTKSMFSGTVLGVILQSSAVVILMIMAFIGAGLLTLPNAIGAVIGANIGATVLAILVVYLGFSFNISTFSLALVAIGGLMQKFINTFTWKNTGKIILSFGFLFFGISVLRQAVEGFTQIVDFTQFANIPSIGWLLIGVGVTAILHSSGAMSIIILGALHGGMINFPQGMLLLAGANIGTCINGIWAAMKGNSEKKQVAAAHIIFNIFASALVFIFLNPITTIIKYFFDFSHSGAQETALALFQLLYVAVAGILFIPLIKYTTILLQKIFKTSKEKILLGIEKMELTEVDISLPVIQKDVVGLLKKIFGFNVHHLRIDRDALLNNNISIDAKFQLEYILTQDDLLKEYSYFKAVEEALLTFILKSLKQPNIDIKDVGRLQDLYDAIERMMYAAKTLKDSENSLFNVFQADNSFVDARLAQLKKNIINLYVTISQIIDKKELKSNYLLVQEISLLIKNDNRKFLEQMSEYLSQHNLDQGLLSDLFHVTQAYERSNSAIIEALKKIFLDKEERKNI